MFIIASTGGLSQNKKKGQFVGGVMNIGSEWAKSGFQPGSLYSLTRKYPFGKNINPPFLPQSYGLNSRTCLWKKDCYSQKFVNGVFSRIKRIIVTIQNTFQQRVVKP